MEDRMADVLVRNWGLMALRGVLALVFGLLTLFFPAATVRALVLVFGAYAVAYGVITIFTAVANRHGERHWVALLVNGVLSILFGVLTFAVPGVTALVLLYLIAAWAIVTGIFEIAAAVRLRKVITGEWMLILAGVLSLLFGAFLIVRPGVGALAVVLWIGAYATVLGVLLIVLAFRLRSWRRARKADGTVRAA